MHIFKIILKDYTANLGQAKQNVKLNSWIKLRNKLTFRLFSMICCNEYVLQPPDGGEICLDNVSPRGRICPRLYIGKYNDDDDSDDVSLLVPR